MKKLIAFFLAVLMVAGLCACGNTQPEVTEPQVPDITEILNVTETPEATEEATEIATEPQQSAYELAKSCEGKPVAELIALVGEPEETDYAPSCLNPGVGEDGNWFYDGFLVYTYREGDTETVDYVEETE